MFELFELFTIKLVVLTALNSKSIEGQIKKLLLDVRTRCNSYYYMLQRFIELVSIVGAILLSIPTDPPMVTGIEINKVNKRISW